MEKENRLSQLEVQRKLWGKICGEQGVEKRIEMAKKGHLPKGLVLSELLDNRDGFESILGNFAPRVLIASDPNSPLTLVPEQIAVAGGWCALRTKDVINLSQKGIIMDPSTGVIAEIKSVEQVNEWIKSASSFDQVIESVGPVNASSIMVISERKLWSQRIAAKLEQIFDRELSQKEKIMIGKSVEEAECIRAIMTERYVRLVTGNKNTVFTRVVDEEVWDDIEKAKSEMFVKAGLSIERLESAFPSEIQIIRSSSLVWAMYSEPYFDILRKRGFIKKKKVFIAEPSLHTYADNMSGNTVVSRIYQDKGIYFDPNGMNKNTGFIAFMECVNSSGQNARKNLAVSEVPNISNWRKLLDEGILSIENNLVLNPKDNGLFIWGMNLFPFGQVRVSLLRLIDIQEEFLKEKEAVTSVFKKSSAKIDIGVRESIQRKVEEVRQEFLKQVRAENEKLIIEFRIFFEYLTEGIEI